MSYPLLLINWCEARWTGLGTDARMPTTAPTDLMTLQASSLSYFQQTAQVAKVGDPGGRVGRWEG